MKLGKSLGPWISLNQIQCALIKDKSGKISTLSLQRALAAIESQPRWLLFGPTVADLRKMYVQGLWL